MRLIDADALREKAYWHGEYPDVGNPYAEGVEAVDVGDIDEAPTIEAEPVKHGRWVFDDAELEYYCSECGHEALIRIGATLHKYCSNCGAKMDLEESK